MRFRPYAGYSPSPSISPVRSVRSRSQTKILPSPDLPVPPAFSTFSLAVAEARCASEPSGPVDAELWFDPALAVAAVPASAQEKTRPLTVLDVRADKVPGAYRHKLVLCRSDQHVAWRGDAVPADAPALVDMLRGARH